jgi:serine/threonine protein phosphatase PrpC
MQGWRVNMEDSHTHILSLPDDPAAAFFAVYDGHGGAHVAEYSGKHLHKFIIKRPEYEKNIAEAMKKVESDSIWQSVCNAENETINNVCLSWLITTALAISNWQPFRSLFVSNKR